MKYQNIITLISRLKNQVDKYLKKELKDNGYKKLAPSHGAIALHLLNNDGLTMSRLSHLISKEPATTTVLVKKLVDSNLVTTKKSEKDTRVILVYLTEEGRKFSKFVVEASEKINELLLKDISMEGLEVTSNTLKQLINNFN